jgi:hypothetical protein
MEETTQRFSRIDESAHHLLRKQENANLANLPGAPLPISFLRRMSHQERKNLEP